MPQKRYVSKKPKPGTRPAPPDDFTFLRGQTPFHHIFFALIIAITALFCTWIVNKNGLIWGLPVTPDGILEVFVSGIPAGATFSLDAIVYSLVSCLLYFCLWGFRQQLDANPFFLGIIANLFASVILGVFGFFVVLPSTVKVFMGMDLIKVFQTNTGYTAPFMNTGLVCALIWVLFLSGYLAAISIANRGLAIILKQMFRKQLRRRT